MKRAHTTGRKLDFNEAKKLKTSCESNPAVWIFLAKGVGVGMEGAGPEFEYE